MFVNWNRPSLRCALNKRTPCCFCRCFMILTCNKLTLNAQDLIVQLHHCVIFFLEWGKFIGDAWNTNLLRFFRWDSHHLPLLHSLKVTSLWCLSNKFCIEKFSQTQRFVHVTIPIILWPKKRNQLDDRKHDFIHNLSLKNMNK